MSDKKDEIEVEKAGKEYDARKKVGDAKEISVSKTLESRLRDLLKESEGRQAVSETASDFLESRLEDTDPLEFTRRFSEELERRTPEEYEIKIEDEE